MLGFRNIYLTTVKGRQEKKGGLDFRTLPWRGKIPCFIALVYCEMIEVVSVFICSPPGVQTGSTCFIVYMDDFYSSPPIVRFIIGSQTFFFTTEKFIKFQFKN